MQEIPEICKGGDFFFSFFSNSNHVINAPSWTITILSVRLRADCIHFYSCCIFGRSPIMNLGLAPQSAECFGDTSAEHRRHHDLDVLGGRTRSS